MKTKRILIGALLFILLSVAGFFLASGKKHVSQGVNQEVSGEQVWTCSMHPQVRLPRPGKCPICSMPLIPAKKSGPATAGAPTSNAAPGSMLELSDHARAMASVETVPLERRKMVRELRAVGKVQYNETALATITTRVEGYVEKLYLDFTGAEVKAGDHDSCG